jgi:hypothetical protein
MGIEDKLTPPKLIFCAGGNKRFAEIAIENGFLYGARVPRDKPHFPIFFADQDWKKPNKDGYIACVSKYKPKMATVIDLERNEQLPEVLDWAEEISQFAKYIVIIPKISGVINKIPDQINGKVIILGYSVPTKYGSTMVDLGEFSGRLVHLLGGSPHRQMNLWNIMHKSCEVFSVDGNYIQLIAIKFNKFWTNGDAYYAENRWLPRLDEADDKKWEIDAPYEAFRRSCVNVKKSWTELVRGKNG